MGAGVSPVSRRGVLLAGAAIALAVIAAYANSLGTPFVFDDPPSITGNATIRQLWPPWTALSPPAGQGLTVDGRPVLNFSLALNHAVGGTAVQGYHALNLAIHLGAALVLFGLVRRTLIRLGPPLQAGSLPLALAAALLWALHPLQTESVTYIIQRAESLMGLFYLLTVYCFVRGVEAERAAARRAWYVAAVVACLLGAGTKEVTASAPLLVLLYDRAFVAGTFREAWRQRWRLYAGLALIWPLLAWLVLGTGGRGGTAGFGINVTPWDYSLTQYQAICHYLWLSVWPDPLIFDYGTAWVRNAADVAPYAGVVVALVGATFWALVRRPGWGFLGMWFFCILAPTSSLLPGNRQTLAEHRMYLPLAVVAVLGVLGVHRLMARRLNLLRAGYATLAVSAAAALVLGALTVRRNRDYRTELALYRDTVEKRPDNAFARYNLGKALAESKHGDPAEAIVHYEAALRLEPGWAHVHYNLGNALFDQGRVAEAAAHYRSAVRLNPAYVKAHYNLGNALVRLGQPEGALESYRTALRLRPDFVEARDNLGSVLLDLGRPAEAATEFERMVAAGGASAETYCNLGTACLLLDRVPEAVRHFEAALRVKPEFAPARVRLDEARRRLGGRAGESVGRRP
ncbi:MAG: tetratricopeptide repeat protein [Verrucomicrobia bacterium]|nr:tetratricopeptide repeat protein [Verrucomicrobiota bacterium]